MCLKAQMMMSFLGNLVYSHRKEYTWKLNILFYFFLTYFVFSLTKNEKSNWSNFVFLEKE